MPRYELHDSSLGVPLYREETVGKFKVLTFEAQGQYWSALVDTEERSVEAEVPCRSEPEARLMSLIFSQTAYLN
jgi:hypothetical protein